MMGRGLGGFSGGGGGFGGFGGGGFGGGGRSAPTVVIIDNSKDKPKVLKTVKSGSPDSLRKAVLDAVKKLSK